MKLIDLHHLQTPNVIGAWLVDDVLIDCGPSSCLDNLLASLNGRRPRALLLTHIHLDHSGAAGALAERFPGLPIYVHPVGAPHLLDPTRLLKSASRLYGEEMDRLWGPVPPVPERSLHAMEDGEVVLGFRVAFTPGHASHHVALLHLETGRAFVGDAAGVRIPPADLVMPHAPPPEIALDAWSTSLDTITAWRPTSLALPHYGVVDDPDAHLELMRARLWEKANMVRDTADAGKFVTVIQRELESLGSPALEEAYLLASPPQHMFLGLSRYWRKLEEQDNAGSDPGGRS